MLSNLSTSHFMRNQSTYYVDNFLDNTTRSDTEQALKDYKDFFNVEDIFDN